MNRIARLAATAALLPAAVLLAATSVAAQEFRLYQGSEASLAYGQVGEVPGFDGTVESLALDTRHTIWLAPFLGTQVDLGAARVDWEDTVLVGGLHLHVLPETAGGARFGAFWTPAWDDGFGDRVDAYGLESIVRALPALTVEARVGRFDGAAVEGPFVGVAGYYALDREIALTARLEHSRLDVGGGDLNASDVLVGAEYYLPGSSLRLSGGLGAFRYTGDAGSGTDLRLQVGATLFAFGAPATADRPRAFGRQAFLGLF